MQNNEILFTKPNGEITAISKNSFNFWALIFSIFYILFKQNWKYAGMVFVMALVVVEIDTTGLLTLLLNVMVALFTNKANAYCYLFDKGYICSDEDKEWIRNNCKPFGWF